MDKTAVFPGTAISLRDSVRGHESSIELRLRTGPSKDIDCYSASRETIRLGLPTAVSVDSLVLSHCAPTGCRHLTLGYLSPG